MSAPKKFDRETRETILAFLKGDLKYRQAAILLKKSHIAFAFMVVEYSRWIVQRKVKK